MENEIIRFVAYDLSININIVNIKILLLNGDF